MDAGDAVSRPDEHHVAQSPRSPFEAIDDITRLVLGDEPRVRRRIAAVRAAIEQIPRGDTR